MAYIKFHTLQLQECIVSTYLDSHIMCIYLQCTSQEYGSAFEIVNVHTISVSLSIQSIIATLASHILK